MKYQYAITVEGRSSIYIERSDGYYYSLQLPKEHWQVARPQDSWSMNNRIPDTLLRLLGVLLE